MCLEAMSWIPSQVPTQFIQKGFPNKLSVFFKQSTSLHFLVLMLFGNGYWQPATFATSCIYVKIQYWGTLPALSLKKSSILYKKMYVKTLCVLFYALMLVDINLIILFASLEVYS